MKTALPMSLALLGLLPKRAGRIVGGHVLFEGVDLVGLSERELRRIRGRRIGMIFQDPLSSLNPVLTVGRQITEQIEGHTRLSGGQAKRDALSLLARVAFPDPDRAFRTYPHQLSGGMRQRAMIAMSLSCRPSLLIADEPTSALDVTTQAQILTLLAELRSEFGLAVLLITHDLGLVAGFAERTAVMYAGRIVEIGMTEQVIDAPTHPYTLGLLGSVARFDRPKGAVLPTIPGMPPDLSQELIGCPFRPRCRFAIARCTTADPPLEINARGSYAACWVPQAG